jgi:hypothetical protein
VLCGARAADQYQALKDAVRVAEVQPLFERMNAIRPLRVDAAAAFNWFDLQIGHDSFGSLASVDQALLAGTAPNPADVLRDLLPGGAGTMPLLRELGAALIAYTPPTFETICCQITEGIEQGQRTLFYDISCPQLPGEGTTVVNDRGAHGGDTAGAADGPSSGRLSGARHPARAA